MWVFFGGVFFHPFNKSSSSVLGFLHLRILALDLLRRPAALLTLRGRADSGRTMKPTKRRRCRHCGRLYEPDPRNRFHQRHCSEPACRQASKAASQGSWRASPKGRDYFRGSANRLRVQAWRKAHPGYGTSRRQRHGALQDHCLTQAIVPAEDKLPLDAHALQDFLITQGLALTGLVAQLAGSPLQDVVASVLQQLILTGQQIRGANGVHGRPHFQTG